jgi:poly(ADP-ribose) glycohydrolase ARH3
MGDVFANPLDVGVMSGHHRECRGGEVGEPREVATQHEDRCIGSLLGLACGDVLGAGVEGYSREALAAEFGTVRDFLDTPRGRGCYTDDTQMALALARSLVEARRAHAAHAANAYAQHFDPRRGYGAGAKIVLRALAAGADYRQTGRSQFPEGSFGNGGAMRIAPVGLAYRHASEEVLRQAVTEALLCTHVHPEAVDGATLLARAVATAACTDDSQRFDGPGVVETLAGLSQHDAMQEKVATVRRGLKENWPDEEAARHLGTGIRTAEAVPAALWCVGRYAGDPEECIVRAVALGGDTDTIGAMAGAVVGALHGTGWVPARWFGAMENGPDGRDAIIEAARRLAELDLR